MPYEYLNDMPTTDIVLRVWGRTLEETLMAAAEAMTTAILGEVEVSDQRNRRSFELREASREALFVGFLQTLIRYKDEESLVLRVRSVSLTQDESGFSIRVQAEGILFDQASISPEADISDVPLGRFVLTETPEGWGATLVLEV